MQLQNIQQQNVERVEVHYECLLKLTNCLQVKMIDIFPTIISRIGLLPYLILTTSMKWDTLIEHKVLIICEENGLVSLNYNVLLTTPKANVIVKPIVFIIIAKYTLTYTNCGKTCHILETCHNQKWKVPVSLTTTINYIKLVVGTNAQPIKLVRIPLHCPHIIYSSVKHRYGDCLRKLKYKTCSKPNLLIPI
jgi:hypothetical protein